jgi:Cu/Zn superoxide dismutase
MRMRHAALLALVGAMTAACDTRDEAETEPGLLPGDDQVTTEQDMMVSRSEFQATPQAEGLQVSGWTELRQRGTTMDDGLELRVHLMGLGEGDHAWHIHSGTCESPGPIVLALSDAPAGMEPAGTQPGTTQPRTDATRDGIASDLDAGSDGMVEETVNFDREHVQALSAQGQNLIIAVHQRGGDNPGPAIACAPLQLTGTGFGTGTYGAPGMTDTTRAPGTTGSGTGY